jgi:hypothetical protein
VLELDPIEIQFLTKHTLPHDIDLLSHPNPSLPLMQELKLRDSRVDELEQELQAVRRQMELRGQMESASSDNLAAENADLAAEVEELREQLTRATWGREDTGPSEEFIAASVGLKEAAAGAEARAAAAEAALAESRARVAELEAAAAASVAAVGRVAEGDEVPAEVKAKLAAYEKQVAKLTRVSDVCMSGGGVGVGGGTNRLEGKSKLWIFESELRAVISLHTHTLPTHPIPSAPRTSSV